MAGQFAMVGFLDTTDPLLNRPLSIASFEGEGTQSRVGFLVVQKGKGTLRLGKQKPNEKLRILLPLGSSFWEFLLDPKIERVVAVAGGVGLAPIAFLSSQIKKYRPGIDFLLFYGARTKDELALSRMGEPVKWFVATEDGSKGHLGRVTELFESKIAYLTQDTLKTRVVACGPLPMLKALHGLSMLYGFELIVSLEGPMGCGMGICLGCVLENAQGTYIKLCKKGPVMAARDVGWERLGLRVVAE
jgi:dihydroorotate dehydrogenase electron transfer subunit